MDLAIEQAVSRETGQQPPFPDESLRSVTYLHVHYARTLEDLSRFRDLEIVQLVGCDPVDLGRLTHLAELSTIVVEFGSLKDLAGVQNFPSLRRFSAGMNMIEDLTPLLECPKLRRLDVRGNPLSEHSYRTLAPQLEKKGIHVSLSGESEWRMTLDLRRHGFPYSFYKAHDGTRICRPGLALTGMPDKSHPIVDREELEELLRHQPENIPKLFERDDRIPTTFGP
ncbi:leucine-rich repeat domain-containing protein [Streptomyces sp. CFMR 7]|uniref:leucine-rich repeat domain-containing protein n=1 Tax=Streptomyces sp. CFMR 7 TaxID=1649184 RepID=UPI0011AA46F6|nr:leucine-rich repeat domain-containing protein [Streptomyces sp. CFMR 7]